MGWLKFNNVTTNKDDSDPNATIFEGVVIQAPPIYEVATKNYDVLDIEGKNGGIVIDKGYYSNTQREYNLASAFDNDGNFISKVRQFVDWLMKPSGYARLEDSYEPDYFRLAMYIGGGQLPNLYDKATGIIVRFNCKPQRFLKTGDIPIVFTETQSTWYMIENNTINIALPEITFEGQACKIEVISGEDVNNPDHITVFDTVEALGNVNSKFTIDSELQDVYSNTEYVNDKVTLSNGFPKLYPGKNWIKITFEPSTSEVSIKPRWWVI